MLKIGEGRPQVRWRLQMGRHKNSGPEVSKCSAEGILQDWISFELLNLQRLEFCAAGCAELTNQVDGQGRHPAWRVAACRFRSDRGLGAHLWRAAVRSKCVGCRTHYLWG